MHLLDWIVVGVYLVWMVWDGVRRTEDSDKVEGYLLANRSLPWWAVGLSVMATQLSAITLVGGDRVRATPTACASCSSTSACRSP